MSELHHLKASHPLIARKENAPVLTDVNQAALEGDVDAIEAQGILADLQEAPRS